MKTQFKHYIYQYKGFGNCNSKCGVMIWHNLDTNIVVVLLSELSDNRGTSITNMSEYIATQIAEKENFPVSTVWFETYIGYDNTFKDEIDLITYEMWIDGDRYSKPKWEFYGLDKFKELLKNSFNVMFEADFMKNLMMLR